MTNFINLDKKYQICLSMTWYPGGEHLISGHVFEILDYYFLLTSKYNVCILFGDTFTDWNQFKETIVRKYNVSDQQLQGLKDDTIFSLYPKYVKGQNILFVDGGLYRLQIQGTKLLFKNIITFKCSYRETVSDLSYKSVILQDNRVYRELNPEDTEVSIHYVKKINFDMLKSQSEAAGQTALLYLTKNCRSVTEAQLSEIYERYKFTNYLIVTDDPGKYKKRRNVTILPPPVDNLFELFTTYIYTPLAGRFDGSPRFPAECKYYNKNVLYHDIDVEYLNDDRGLYYRRLDIENNFLGLYLKAEDEIFNIIGELV